MKQKQNNELIDLIYELTTDPHRFEDLVLEINKHVSKTSSLSSLIRRNKPEFDIQLKLDDVSENTLKIPNELNPIIGHLERAMTIVQHINNLEKENNILSSFFDQLPIGLVLLDEKLSIISCNQEAYEGLDIKGIDIQGMNLSDINMSLYTDILSKRNEFINKKDIVRFTQNKKNIYVTRQNTKQHNLKIGSRRFYALLIPNEQFDIVKCHPDFADRYDLSKRELQIVNKLIRGLSIKEISEIDAVSEGTVRQQVKSIYSKTEARSQSALISLALRNPATMITATLLNDYCEKASNNYYKSITLPSGRIFAYEEYGHRDAPPLLVIHNFGGCRWQVPFVNADLSKNKYRLIIPDRPGFGRSSVDVDMTYLSFADDLVCLVDNLKLKNFDLLGYSSGGPCALAFASKYPDRVKRLIVVSPSMSLNKKEEKRKYMAAALPKINKLLFDMIYEGWKNKPKRYLEHLYGMAGSGEKDLFKSIYFRNQRISLFKESSRQGTAQLIQELSLVNNDWGFDLSEIQHKVEIWYGDEDYHTPESAFERLGDSLQNSEMHFVKGYGLFLYYALFEKIMSSKN